MRGWVQKEDVLGEVKHNNDVVTLKLAELGEACVSRMVAVADGVPADVLLIQRIETAESVPCCSSRRGSHGKPRNWETAI